MNHHKIVALVLLVALLSAPVASADVLVTKEGARVETQGSWEVRGRQVIFTTPKGVLSSMRLAEVDLEASERATHAPPAAAEEESEPAVEAVWSLTDDDVPQAAGTSRQPLAEQEDDDESAPEDEAVEAEKEKAEDRAERCRPNLTPGQARISGRTVTTNGAAVPQADCPDIAQIHWFWGDGRASYSWFPAEHTYEQPGRYQVVVTARDLEGHETVAKTTVTIR